MCLEMPYRERRKSVVDMLAKVPVHRGSLLRSLDDLLKTIEISESTVMIPTLLRDKCQFDAWELLFVAKILKASILGHSDLVEFYMNHMGNQASIQQHQQELNKANCSSHEQLLRNKTASNSSSNLSATQTPAIATSTPSSQLYQHQSQPHTPTSEQLDSLTPTTTTTTITTGKSNLSINNNTINVLNQEEMKRPASCSQEYHSASSSITSNGITSWMSALESTSAASGATSSCQLQDVASGQLEDDHTTEQSTATPINNHNNNNTTNNSLMSPCHSISEETHIEMVASKQANEHNGESSLLILSGRQLDSDRPKPPNRLQLPPTPSNPHDQINGGSTNNPHSGLAESPMSLSQINIEQLASRFESTVQKNNLNKSNCINLNARNQDQSLSPINNLATSNGSPIGLGVDSNFSISPNESSGAGLITSDERLVRNCRSTSCLSRINSGASSPHGNNTPATANGLHPVSTTPIATPVAGSLAAALNAVGSEPVADPASAPVKLLLQIEQLKTSINQVRNLLESVVELYKNSIDNLAVN